MIDDCLGVTVIGLGITGVGLILTIVAAPAVIGMEAVSIVMGLLRVVGNRVIKTMSLNIEKHENVAMLAVSSLAPSVVSFQKHYHMTSFQMKNIH